MTYNISLRDTPWVCPECAAANAALFQVQEAAKELAREVETLRDLLRRARVLLPNYYYVSTEIDAALAGESKP